MSHRRRVDANHAEVKDALERYGWEVLDLSRVGGGVPDLFIYHPARFEDRWRFVEVKTPEALKGRSGNPATKKRQADFRAKWPVVVVSCVDDVAKL